MLRNGVKDFDREGYNVEGSRMLKASDVMTRDVIAATEDMPIEIATRLMLDHHFSGLPVVDSNGELVGIVTEGDLLRRVELGTGRRRSGLYGLFAPASVARDYVLANGRRAGEIMTREVISVGPGTPLQEIVEIMEAQRIKRIPVVERGHLAGIVSRADILKALLGRLRGTADVDLPDEEIRTHVVAEIRKQPWSTRNAGVMVKDGIVHLHGIVYDYREHIAMRVAAANAPGVKGIRDELQCIEPVSGVPIETGEEVANLPPA
jgi:CBS domain-containing protein